MGYAFVEEQLVQHGRFVGGGEHKFDARRRTRERQAPASSMEHRHDREQRRLRA